MEQRAQILLPTTEIGGSVKYFMSIENPFRTNTENWMDPIIQPTLLQFNQATGLGHSDRNQFPLGSLDSGTYVSRSGRNINNRTGMNSQGPITAMIPESNSVNNCYIFNSVSSTYRLQGLSMA